jgi:hypothetical protein
VTDHSPSLTAETAIQKKIPNIKCQCFTAWVVDFADARGERLSDYLTAAMASGMRFRVELQTMSLSPPRPVWLSGVNYGDGPHDRCAICGWPIPDSGTSYAKEGA